MPCTSSHIYSFVRQFEAELIIAGFNLDLAVGSSQSGTVDLSGLASFDTNTTYRAVEYLRCFRSACPGK